MEQEKILRINELAKKKKEVGLTDEETRERSALYAQYIKEFREQTEATLKRVRVEQEDGSYKPAGQKRKQTELKREAAAFLQERESAAFLDEKRAKRRR